MKERDPLAKMPLVNFNTEEIKKIVNPQKCAECPDIECTDLPFVRHIRLVSFKQAQVQTWSLDSVDECTFKRYE